MIDVAQVTQVTQCFYLFLYGQFFFLMHMQDIGVSMSPVSPNKVLGGKNG